MSLVAAIENAIYIVLSLFGYWIFYLLASWIGILVFPIFSACIGYILNAPNGFYPLVLIMSPFTMVAQLCVKK